MLQHTAEQQATKCTDTMPPNTAIEATGKSYATSLPVPEENGTESSISLEERSSARQTLRSKKSTQISWGSVHLREFPIIPGDNPAAIGGVPVTIDWEHVDEIEIPLEELEPSEQSPHQHRSMIEMRMPPAVRNDMLRRLGFSRCDVTAALKAANIARNQRRRTAETMNLASMEESLEKVKRATLNATLRRSRKMNEKKMLETFCGKNSHIGEKVKLDDSGAGTVGTAVESVVEHSTVGNSSERISVHCRRHRNSILIR